MMTLLFGRLKTLRINLLTSGRRIRALLSCEVNTYPIPTGAFTTLRTPASLAASEPKTTGFNAML